MADEARPKCTHVIFDMDGLLLDTERIYTEFYNIIFNEYGKTFDMTLKVKAMGMNEQTAAQTLLRESGLPITLEEFLAKAASLKIEMFPSAKLLPGVERLVHHLHANNIPIAVATGSATFEFDLKTTHHKGLFTLFEHILKGDDPAIKHGKPNPDIYEVAAARFKTPPASPSHVLVLEDAPNGLLAGKAAGMPVVMVPEAYVDKAMRSGASQVLSSLVDFEPTKFGLPAF